MSSEIKCSCGSSEIEQDSARGDLVCTACGTVLESNLILSEVQYEDTGHGSSSAIGQFISAESKSGPRYENSFHLGMGVESREMTMKRARNGITNLGNQLNLTQMQIEISVNFFKCALQKNLTKGRKNTHVHGACVYLTCRTERTEHLLIDISDKLQICCYKLGRTYLKLSQALCIKVPPTDPCLYIMRFASRLEFGAKTLEVVNTASRLVQRMKRDSLHSGRRPSGLCGAALLIAARLHDFGRSANDIVKIVKVHESTLRKRLIEFGETPSSALTLDEFMTIDLEQELAPPSFKAARKKDRERLQKLMEEEADTITELQREIESQLDRAQTVSQNTSKRKRHANTEAQDTSRFIEESTLGTIKKIMEDEAVDDPGNKELAKELGPDMVSMGLVPAGDDSTKVIQTPPAAEEIDLTFDDIDDEELDSYIMTEPESQTKSAIWHKRNASFLEEQKIKAERLKKDQEEGREKKKKKTVRRKAMAPTNSVWESIEKIIQVKKISSKINYDVLKSLNASLKTEAVPEEEISPILLEPEAKRPRMSTPGSSKIAAPKPNVTRHHQTYPTPTPVPVIEAEAEMKKEENPPEREPQPPMSEEETDEFDEEDEPTGDGSASESGLISMLKGTDDNDYGEYDYDNFYE